MFVATDSLGLAADDPAALPSPVACRTSGSGQQLRHARDRRGGSAPSRGTGSIGLVAANGGIISKYAAGVYSTTPTPWPVSADPATRRRRGSPVESVDEFTGEAVVETFTVTPYRGAMVGILVCRADDGRRFYANADPADEEFAEILATGEPIGTRVTVRPVEGRNTATRC